MFIRGFTASDLTSDLIASAIAPRIIAYPMSPRIIPYINGKVIKIIEDGSISVYFGLEYRFIISCIGATGLELLYSTGICSSSTYSIPIEVTYALPDVASLTLLTRISYLSLGTQPSIIKALSD